jgi:hypothetical protein
MVQAGLVAIYCSEYFYRVFIDENRGQHIYVFYYLLEVAQSV